MTQQGERIIVADIEGRLLKTAGAFRLMALECEEAAAKVVARSNDVDAPPQTYGHRLTVLVGGLHAAMYRARLHMLIDLASRADVQRAGRDDLTSPMAVPIQRKDQPQSESVV